MPLTHQVRRLTLAAALTVGATALLPSAALALTTSITGDDGNAVPLNGAVIRNMNPSAGISLTGGEKLNYSATFLGPDGVNVASTISCSSSPTTRALDYRGNGAYTVTVTTYGEKDFSCAQAPTAPATSTTFAITAGTALVGPATPVLTRAPNAFATNTVPIGINLNPGALTHEIRYAANGVLGPDGAFSGPSAEGFVDTTTGTVPLRLTTPGTYTVIARAKGFTGSGGQFFSPWSAPVLVHAIAPFDVSTSRFTDTRGPAYGISVRLREESARGRVYLSYARGKTGGTYHSLGSAKLSSKGSFQKRFRLKRTGTYRMRLRFKGSDTVAPGVVVQTFKISRRVVFG